MDRKKFTQDFSRRLEKKMREEGHQTDRVGLGINIRKLAKISNCSYQMARKYILGLALPDITIIIKIAAWLKVSPSWLLFEEESPIQNYPLNNEPCITINLDLLKYILNKSSFLFTLTDKKENIINFLIDTIYDAAHLNADIKTIQKVVDLMLTSVTLLNNPSKDNKLLCGS